MIMIANVEFAEGLWGGLVFVFRLLFTILILFL